MIENKPYTLYINVATNDPNYVFTLDSRAFVNNEASSLTIADDWHYATITRQIKPHYLAPTVWHNPTDEAHNRGDLFAFLASAQPGYTSFEWYLRSPDNREIRAENITEIYPEVRVSIEDLESVEIDMGDVYDLHSTIYTDYAAEQYSLDDTDISAMENDDVMSALTTLYRRIAQLEITGIDLDAEPDGDPDITIVFNFKDEFFQ